MSDEALAVSIEKIFDAEKPEDIKKPLVSAFANLDSNNLLPTFGNDPLVWSYNRACFTVLGSIYTLARLSDLLHMKIHNCALPYLNTYTLSVGNRVGILIQEFARQSFITPYGTNFHFLGEADTTLGYMSMSFYNYNRGDFYMTSPITEVNTFTLKIFDPFNELLIPRQLRYAYFTVGSNPLTITYTNPHYFTNGETIILSGFVSNNSIVDALVNTNHIITVVDSLTITVPVDISAVIPTVTYITTNYPKFNVCVPLQFDFYLGNQS